MNKKIVIIPIVVLLLITGCTKNKEENLDISEFNIKNEKVKMNDDAVYTTQKGSKNKKDTDKIKVDGIKGKKAQINQKQEQILDEKGLEENKEKTIEQNKEGTTKPISQILSNEGDIETLKHKKFNGEIDRLILNRKELDKEDNTRYSWWLRLNKNHEVSGIDPYAEKIIDDYKIVYAGDKTQKKVYLTFDEGYENGYTPQILDTLKENDVKAIFFITGSYLKRNPNLVKRMLDEGHKVGSHSVNHPSFPNLASKDYDKLEQEMLNLEQDFYNQFGIGFSYIRPPRGEYSKRTLKAANQLGYKNVFWSYAYKDYDVNDQKGTEYAYNRVMDHVHNGMVVLLHAVSKDNANALDEIIKDIKSQGYEICPFNL